jgi:RNA polymerase II subunit A small phosphatase-like protein
MKYKNEQKILLILDIDETLIYSTRKELERKADFYVFSYHVYKRPYLKEFLEQVNNDFLLAIWSSASDDYVEEVVKKIIPQEIELEFVWGRSRCTYQRNYRLDESRFYSTNPLNHYNFVKILKKVKRKGYQIERILIVDDTPHKSKYNYGNAIYPKEYQGEEHDEELTLLGKYLKKLKDKPNVRNIEKRNWRRLNW